MAKREGGNKLAYGVLILAMVTLGGAWLVSQWYAQSEGLEPEPVATATEPTTDQGRIEVLINNEVPLARLQDVVVTEEMTPPIIGVTLLVAPNENTDLTLVYMDEIVCALKDAGWDGYRYRLAARLGVDQMAGIIMAIEPEIIAELVCDAGMAINWVSSTSEYFIIESLQN
ncbi:MAG: hypothetical protein AAFN11_04830 [Chloroflexota bacterium]